MNQRRSWGIYILFLVLLAAVWFASSARRTAGISKSAFEKDLKSDNMVSVEVRQNEAVPTGAVSYETSDSKDSRIYYVSDVKEAEAMLDDAGISYQIQDVKDNNWLSILLPTILTGVFIVLFLVLLSSMQSRAMNGDGAGGRMANFGKSHAKLTHPEDSKVRFDDVAGLHEEKEQMKEVVDFLKDPDKYTRIGARIPKGMLLVGPPGTGKTMLAKAIAGEAGVPFFSISGSDFVEMFVGVGASRVRDLFSEAKKNAPCIVFIDEIDAVARKRGAGLGGSHDEREQTLNQMLVEMDGFDVNTGIIVLAATNRVDILDPAIMRPGRFDRKVYVGRPDIREREEILLVHSKNKPLGDDVDLTQIAQTTAGFTGADLENLLNESAIRAAEENKNYITMDDIKTSFVKVGLGTEKKSRIISEKEKKITAYHESGHAILFHLLPDVGPVYSVSIIPTGMGAAGYTMPLPEKDEMFLTRSKMLEDIEVSLGGRIAEQLIFGDITTGASNDIKQATRTARDMVMKYGMSDHIGTICYEEEDEEVFLGKDLAHTKPYSEEIATEIDKEVKSIMDQCYAKATELIQSHMDVLHASAKLLMEKEKINRQEFEALFEKEEPVEA
ncbi:ATP-dependent zinc metalloprotease FtsH [Lachnospiraceae bacterium YH-ros2228]|nr:ATP-dependent zinc metalloprotease FtsH [Lachnospiraceae bacterium]MDD6579237.1 ATP-dependent zinc metalloprotease FtsH [Lachnospiraceae bacterium]